MRLAPGLAKAWLMLAALPLVALAALATVDARDDVGVLMTGGGAHAVLGAAWVACWLGAVIVSPIAVGAALVSWLLTSRPRSRST